MICNYTLRYLQSQSTTGSPLFVDSTLSGHYLLENIPYTTASALYPIVRCCLKLTRHQRFFFFLAAAGFFLPAAWPIPMPPLAPPLAPAAPMPAPAPVASAPAAHASSEAVCASRASMLLMSALVKLRSAVADLGGAYVARKYMSVCSASTERWCWSRR